MKDKDEKIRDDESTFQRLSYCGPIGYDMPSRDKRAIRWAGLRLCELEIKHKRFQAILNEMRSLPDRWESKDMTNPEPLITAGAVIAFNAAALELRNILEKFDE